MARRALKRRSHARHRLFAGYDRPGREAKIRVHGCRGEPEREEPFDGGRSQRVGDGGASSGRARDDDRAGVSHHGGRTARRRRDPHRGDAFTLTWGELRDRVDALAGGLAELGLKRGDTLALMLSNRPEFHICDLAGMMIGATPFSIYNTYTAEQIRYLIEDADARIMISEQQFLPQVMEAREQLPQLEHVIVVDGGGASGDAAAAREVEAMSEGFDVEASVAQIEPTDVLTLIYTSGTTGPPKGVQLIHRNLLAACDGLEELIEFPRDGRVISWLPAAHVAERNAHHYLPIVYGLQITCCDDPRQVLSYLPEVRPSWFFAVPRIWEKLKAGLETMMAAQPDEKREADAGGARRVDRKVRMEQRGEEVPAELAEQVAKADAEIFAGLREMLGLDRVEAINVGAAPTPVEVLEFFHAIGLPLAELWGMSETCGAGTVNPHREDPDRHRRAARAGRRDQARQRRRGADSLGGRDARLPQPPREDGRGVHRGRLPAHR